MLRVVIAEDEALIREGLKREIPWRALGMEVVGLAANGLEAVELCRERSADILLTDIRMPLLDGLALIERVRELAGEVVFLIISGYDDFQYAQKAISLGVSHYFLKPLELDQIEAKLKEVGARILEERSRRQEQERIGRFVTGVLPFVRRQYFLQLLYEPFDNRELAGRLAELGALDQSTCCAVVLVEAAPEDPSVRDRVLERRLARLLRNRYCPGEDIYLLRRTAGGAQLVVVLTGDEPAALHQRLEGCLQEMGVLRRVKAAAAGGVVRGLDRLHESFAEARRGLLLHQLLRRAGLPPPAGPAPGTPASGALRRAEQALAAGDAAGVEEALAELRASLGENPADTEGRTAVLSGLFRLLSRRAEDGGINPEIALLGRREEPGYARGGDPGAGFERAFAALKAVALEAASRRGSRKEKPARYLIDEARRYIEARYSAWDLSLEDVAEHVGLNPSYFSSVFKSVTGVNYIDYVTGLRLDKARELLKDPRLKIGAVAHMVGFQTPGYFGYLFRKHFDRTPSEYRAAVRQAR
jgi:two-component system response regulator YesN